MKRQGLLTHYNGIDTIRITLHCDTYVQKILDNHGWSDMRSGKLPMSSDSGHI
jgi:hypothetical protein